MNSAALSDEPSKGDAMGRDQCPECGVHAGHDSDCSWAKLADDNAGDP
jgi:hypothetical protein